MATSYRLPVAGILGLCIAACGGGGGSGASPTAGPSTPATPAAATTATLSGRIADRQGAGVAGATVTLFHHNTNTSASAATDTNGNFSFANVQAGVHADYVVYAQKDGYAFVPAPTDPSAAIDRFDFNGLYRTAVRYALLPARTVGGTNFTALRNGDRLASVPRTGAQASFAPGDDGARASGVAWPAQRFTDNGDGTVRDALTGLVWLKNAGCFQPQNWADALAAANKLAQGSCGLTDGSSAGQWRMPNINELESLVDVAQASPALAAARPFTNVGTGTAYWSSTTYTAGPGNAMAIRFSDGRWINGIDPGDGGYSNAKDSGKNLLWAVKSGGAGAVALLSTGVFAGQGGGSYGANDDAALRLGVSLPSPRFIDNGDGTLTDSTTGLVWLKQADCIRSDWRGTLDQIAALGDGSCGLKDGSKAGQWRLPNRAEMLSLADRAPTFPIASYYNGQYTPSGASTGPSVFRNFIAFDYYWSSSTYAPDAAQAWTVYSCDFGVYNLPKGEKRYALAVR